MSRDMTKPTKWLCAQRRLIRPVWSVFAVRMKKAWVLSYPLSAQRRLWSDWADAQADLSLRWAHSHFVRFVMRRLISISNLACSTDIMKSAMKVNKTILFHTYKLMDLMLIKKQYISVNGKFLPIWNSQNCSMFPLAFVAGWLQGTDEALLAETT